jgi:hypothetical protein
MKHAIVVYLPWLISCITIYQSLLAGDKKLSAWGVALGNQCLWSLWVITSGTWGLLPLNIALWIIYTRNYRKWARDARLSSPSTTR